MKFLTTIICFLFALNVNAQVFDVNYIRFDTTNIIQHQLQFKNDSIIIKHSGLGSIRVYQEFNYTNLNDTIMISKFENGQDLYLIKENEVLVNHHHKLVYAKSNHPNHNYIITIINGKKLIMNPNKWSYINEAYYKQLRRYNLDAYELELVTGYNAYIRFGYNYIFGVCYYK